MYWQTPQSAFIRFPTAGGGRIVYTALTNTKICDIIKIRISGCSAVGSARHLGCWGRRFDSCHSDHRSNKKSPCVAGHFLFDAKGFGLRRFAACPQLFSRRVFCFAVFDRDFALRAKTQKTLGVNTLPLGGFCRKIFLVTLSQFNKISLAMRLG